MKKRKLGRPKRRSSIVPKKKRPSTAGVAKPRKKDSTSSSGTASTFGELPPKFTPATKAQSAMFSTRDTPRCPVCHNNNPGQVVFYGILVWNSNDCPEDLSWENGTLMYKQPEQFRPPVQLPDEMVFVCSTKHDEFENGNHRQGSGYCGHQWLPALPTVYCANCRFKNEMLVENRNHVMGFYCVVCDRFSASPRHVDNLHEKL